MYAYFQCLNETNGRLIYILDDAYIHMAIAKNTVSYSVFGITPFETSSSSSSPLWTLILILIFTITGINDYIPFVMNILICFAILIFMFYMFRKYKLNGFYIFLSLLTVIIVTPLAINIFTGMEHLLHALLTLMLIYYSVFVLVKKRSNDEVSFNYMLLISLLVIAAVSVRYESLILIFIISALFLTQKNYSIAFTIIFSALVPVMITGFISLKLGGEFLPNSVLLKIFNPDSVNFIQNNNKQSSLITYLDMNKKIIVVLIFTLSLFILHYRLNKNFCTEITLSLFIITLLILIQKIFFSLSFFRYDTYLIVTGMVYIFIGIYKYFLSGLGIELNAAYFLKKKTALVLIVFYSAALIYKLSDTGKIIIASENIYDQQFQMSRFIGRYYPEERIALNDIGVVNYFNEIRCTDLIGIGSNDITKDKLEGRFSKERIDQITVSGKVKIAFLYDSWFSDFGGLPSEWRKAGEWKIRNNFICGDEKVSIYAIETVEKEKLCESLKAFSIELPESVEQTYFCPDK